MLADPIIKCGIHAHTKKYNEHNHKHVIRENKQSNEEMFEF